MLHATITTSAPPVIWSIGSEKTELVKRHQARDVLFRQGDDVSSIYEIIEGVARVYKIFADGRRQIMAFAYPGDLLGFAENGSHRFDCDALTDMRVRVIPRRSLLHAVRERPELGEKMLAQATNEISSMQDLSILLCRKTALERLATFLVSLTERLADQRNGACALPMTRGDIADHLGLTIETISRNFSKLRGRQIISLLGTSMFKVNDMPALVQIADCEDWSH